MTSFAPAQPRPEPTASDGLAALAGRLAAGETTAAEQLDRVLDGIEATKHLGAWALLRAKAARQEAAEADRRLAAGGRAPLLGVPVAVKDDTDIAGEPTAFGCRGAFPAATEDAEVIRRLREAGAVIVGKTTSPELGQWPFTESEAWGPTRNPWSLEHSPGGSSGGSAVAVAAGVVPAAVGSDGAGSVRIPAAWTHLVGVKPQRGRVSSWPEADAFHGLTTHGVLARTVADAALLLDVIRGSHPGDRHRLPEPEEPMVVVAGRDPGRLRIGVSTTIPYSLVRTRLDAEIDGAVQALATRLGELGHNVVQRPLRYGLVGGLSFLPRSFAGLHEWRQRVPGLLPPRSPHPSQLRARPCRRRAVGAGRRPGRTGLRGAHATRLPVGRRRPLSHHGHAAPSSWGVRRARRVGNGARVAARSCPFAWPWNVLGWPAVSVPAGFTSAGLPIGVQLLGPPGQEGRLLALGAQLESVQRWDRHRPPHGLAAGT